MQISVDISGDKKLIDRMRRLGLDLKDFTAAMKDIGSYLTRYYSNEGFLSQGGVFGNRWEALSPSTKAYKAKHYRAGVNKPLVGSGTMQNSFESVSNRDTVVIGNSADYFKYHQSTAPRKKLPRRQMMGINNPIRRQITNILQEDIQKKLKKV